MMKKAKFLPIALSLGCMLAVPSLAHAEEDVDMEKFEQLMLEGIAFYKKGTKDPGNYAKAIVKFEQAKLINPIPDITYNIARSHHLLGNCEEALKAYREYTLEVDKADDTILEYISSLSTQCGSRQGTLKLKCVPENAVVSIDNKPNVACTGNHTLTAGDHSLLVTAEGHEPETRKISIAGGSQVTNVVVEMRSFVVKEPEEQNQIQNEFVEESWNNTATESSSRVISSEEDDSSMSHLSGMFWGGAITSGVGIILMLGGGIAMGTSFEGKGEYDKKVLTQLDESKLAGGGAVFGIGTAAALAGVTLLILDRFWTHDDDPQAIHIKPTVSFDGESTSAGMTMTF